MSSEASFRFVDGGEG